MKAKFYLKPALLVILGTVIINLNAEAQPTGNSGKSHSKERKAYAKSGKHGPGKETVYRYDEHQYQGNRYEENRHDRYSDNGNHDPYRHYDYDRYGNGKKKYKTYHDARYHNGKSYTYHHPQYGTVYRSFTETPVRLRCERGYYYFHGGHYYQLYPNVGYVMVQVPRSMIFYEIPSHAVRIRVGGERYYRYGELVFERYNHGYRLAPPSVMININL
ncbi:MAG: hypothetical protein AAGU19_20590 [Prolixibacteraceae bacterium]